MRRVKEGTSATLLQSGLTEEWWQEAMDCYCFLRCVHDKVQGNQTAFEKRFGKPFKGPIIPFGAQIEYKPSQPVEIQALHQFGKKMKAGIFLGYVQHAGGGWTGDLYIADWQQVTLATSSTDVHTKRFKAGEVEIAWKYGAFCFPVAEGDLCVPGDSKEALIRRVGHEVYYKNKQKPSEIGDRAPDEDSAQKDDQEQTHANSSEVRPEPQQSAEDYWTLQGDMLIRHHRRQRLSLFVPDDQNLPIPLKYIDVTRQTETSLESPSEKFINDYWNVPREDPAGGGPQASKWALIRAMGWAHNIQPPSSASS